MLQTSGDANPVQGPAKYRLLVRLQPKKTPAQGRRKVIEAGFIQARNLSSSALFISNTALGSKLKN
jgi:hypothetical protein